MQKQHWSKSLLITVLCKKKDGFPRLIVRKLCLSNKSAGNVSFQTCEENWLSRCRSLHKYLNCTNSSIHRLQLQERRELINASAAEDEMCGQIKIVVFHGDLNFFRNNNPSNPFTWNGVWGLNCWAVFCRSTGTAKARFQSKNCLNCSPVNCSLFFFRLRHAWACS